MQVYWYTGKRHCKKHKKPLQHGLKKGYNINIYKFAYHINNYGYVSHCPDCLNDEQVKIFGGDLFDEIQTTGGLQL